MSIFWSRNGLSATPYPRAQRFTISMACDRIIGIRIWLSVKIGDITVCFIRDKPPYKHAVMQTGVSASSVSTTHRSMT